MGGFQGEKEGDGRRIGGARMGDRERKGRRKGSMDWAGWVNLLYIF